MRTRAARGKLGYAERYKAKIVNYADDFVICCQGNAFEAMQMMRQLMGRLRLTVNEEKTHYRRVSRQYFDFLVRQMHRRLERE